jgi:serine/threonine-protein kinase RsbT
MNITKKLTFPIYKDRIVPSSIINKVKKSLKTFGFSEDEIMKIITAIRESILNVIKYANKGYLSLIFIEDNKSSYVEIIVDDEGKPIKDIYKALEKGYSTTNTLGIGLNVIISFMDEVYIIPKENGMHIILRKYLIRNENLCLFYKNFNSMEIALKTLPFTLYSKSGDCGVVSQRVNKDIIFSLWDMVGHGSKEVFRSSMVLRKYILALKEYSLEMILKTINRNFFQDKTLKRASLVIGEIRSSDKSLSLYQLGNVKYIYINRNLIVKSLESHSVLGIMDISLKKQEFKEYDAFIFSSDGINIYELTEDKVKNYLKNKNAYEVCNLILNNHNNPHDDASVMVIKRLKNEKDNL